MRGTQQPAITGPSASHGRAAVHPSMCLVSHWATEGHSQQVPQPDMLPLSTPCLVSHRTGGEEAAGRPRLPIPQKAVPSTFDEWIDAVATAIAKSRNGKAPGRDQVTNEIMKAAGPPFVLAMAMCLQRIAKEGPPLEWRGGKMWPGKRKQNQFLSPANARGLSCASKMGQIYSSVLRPATVPHVLPVLRDQQYGAKAGGGTEFPIMIRRFFFKWAKKEGISAAGLFCDLRKAFYSVLPEEALGPLITADERAELLQAFGFSAQQIADFTNLLLFSGGLLYEAGVPEDLLEALNQWHKATWYTFEDQETYHVHSLGVKPGDTLADVIFAICFVTFHKKVVRTLEEEGLIVTIEIPTPTVFTPPRPTSPTTDSVPGVTPGCCAAPLPLSLGILGPSPSLFPLALSPKKQVSILPPAFRDDCVIQVAAETPQKLLDDLIKAADIVQCIAQQHAMKLQFAQGKTEAVIQLRGRGTKKATKFLADHTPSDEKSCIAALPFACGQHLRIVSSYIHLGTIATMTANLAQDVAQRKNAAAAAEKTQAANLLGAKNIRIKIKAAGHYCHPRVAAICSGNMGRSVAVTA